jgi:hypothetical protein
MSDKLAIEVEDTDTTIRVSADGNVVVWRGNQPSELLSRLVLVADENCPTLLQVIPSARLGGVK